MLDRMSSCYDIIIVGGGIAGLRVGIEAMKRNKNIKCCILEKYGYMGGPLESKLRELVPKMMKPLFQKYMGSYMSEPARAIVMSDAGLTFNFVYAVWNGPGWFQRFAKVINQKVAEGVTDPKELLRIAVDTRKNWSSSSASANSLIAQGGRKIEKIVSSMA